MNHRPINIVLTGGGSGGHITPLLSLARELKVRQPDCRIVYVGHKGDDFDELKIQTHDFDFMVFINAGKFRRYHGGFLGGIFDLKTLALNVRDFCRLPSSIIASLKIMRRFKPSVVFSKGSFVAVPVGIAARLSRLPVVTHDSDSTPGLANRIVGRWATIHATGMPAEYYPYPKSRTEYVGIPIDERIKKVTPRLQAEYRQQLGLPPDSKVLLLSGGGNGSKRLNDLLVAVSAQLLSSNLKLHIVHLTGRSHESAVEQAYKNGLSPAELKRITVKGFTSEFYAYVGAADLVITRAGATTLAELSAAGKACLVIPSPHLTGGHQLKNADQLARIDAAAVAQETIDPDEFLVLINELINNDHRRFELARNLFATAQPKAADKLAQIILRAAKSQ
jgi:UDP-N-acetylglucosamine--N-acetylmuramyl-(pentapeptide) pyrophosphoryl-undecaprenol N-acetylglucosamine transferase